MAAFSRFGRLPRLQGTIATYEAGTLTGFYGRRLAALPRFYRANRARLRSACSIRRIVRRDSRSFRDCFTQIFLWPRTAGSIAWAMWLVLEAALIFIVTRDDGQLRWSGFSKACQTSNRCGQSPMSHRGTWRGKDSTDFESKHAT